jgi:hypothetical protein
MNIGNIITYRPGTRKAVLIHPNASGNTAIVGAKANTKYNLLAWALTFSKACNVKFTDGTNNLTGTYNIPASGLWANNSTVFGASGINLPIDINVDTSVSTIEGDVWYEEVPLYLAQTKGQSASAGSVMRGTQVAVTATTGV